MSEINKIIYGNETLIDLTEDTVNSDNLLYGETAHDASGNTITGAVITHNVIDNLTSTSTEDALSAKQGKVLNESKYGEGDTKVIFGSSNDVPDNNNIVIGKNNSLVTNDSNKIIIGNDISFTDNYGNGNSNEEIAIGKGLISKLRTSENRLYLGYFNANDQTDYSKNEIIIGNGRSDSVRHDFIKLGQHGGNYGTDGYGNLTIDDVNLQITNASSRLSLGVANDVTQSSAWFLPIAIGADNTASGNDYPIAIGTNNVTDASRSITLGQHLNTTKANQVVVGKYNSDVNKPFIIGNGISDANRSNALEIDSNSNALFGGTITDGTGNVLSEKEDKTNKVTSWSSTTTNTNYPSEKLVKDSLDTKQDALPQVINGRYLHTNSTTGALEWSADTVLTGTLAATQTSISFTDASITSTALIDIYTDKFGVNPTNATQSGTTLTLTFDAQQNDLSIKVVIKEI